MTHVSRMLVPALAGCFFVGIAAGWAARGLSAPRPTSRVVDQSPAEVRVASTTAPTAAKDATALVIAPDAVAELRHRRLQLPVDRVDPNAMKGQFGETRANGARGHEAVDILAPRDTPVVAVEDGTIEKLFYSQAGGTTIYQFDEAGRFCYYYAHLERYASGLREHTHVSAGQTLGYVGTSGNAPKNTPHLHFAIFELTPERRWWQGRPIDPYLVFRK